MNWLKMTLALACLSVAACSSTQEGVDNLGNIVVTGIDDAECVAKVMIKISSLDNLVEFPAPQTGLPGNVAVENGRITIPVAPTIKGAVTVDDIVVEIPQGCAPIAGTFEYLGSSFDLRPGENREVSWDDFEEE